MKKSESPKTVEAVKRTFMIIRELYERNSAGVTELSEELSMSKSGVHKHLTTLVDEGYVINDDGEYKLSLKFLSTGEAIKRVDPLYRISVPEIDALAEQTGDFVHLTKIEDKHAFCIYTAEGENSVSPDINVGHQISFHRSAVGKAILAHLPVETRNRILDDQISKSTEDTIVDRSELREQFNRIRNEGIAYEDEENVYGIRGIGTAILSEESQVLGAIGISGPVSLMTDERVGGELAELLRQTANFIEVKYSLQRNGTYQAGSHLEQWNT